MDPRMLTEDIDASIRAMLYGFKGVYDHNLVSLEQPPPDFPALIKQRLRWTQGWYQVRLSSLSLSLSLCVSLSSLSLSLSSGMTHTHPRDGPCADADAAATTIAETKKNPEAHRLIFSTYQFRYRF
jgi:cellulose synthase/poly-beta-1,6-N-acetylglucosamine synthase-like glycosyltransferase